MSPATARPGPPALLLLLPVLGACSGFSFNPLDWFGGDDEVNPPTELVDIDEEVVLRREWAVDVGNGQGDNYTRITPAIDGGTLFAAGENGAVAAVDAATGSVRWRARLDRTVTGGVGAGEGLVALGTRDAEVVALSQSDGAVVWTSRVTSEVVAAPVIGAGIVIAQTVDDKVAALEAADGAQRWIYESTQPPLTLRGTSRPLLAPDGSVVAGFSNGTLVSVSAGDGVWRWEERVAAPEGQYDIDRVIDVDGELLLDDNRVFAASYQGNIMAFDLPTGRAVWGLQDVSSYHGLARGFGNLYYCDSDGRVVAVRDNTEAVAWENEELMHRSVTAPLTVGNYVAVADFEGYVHLLSQVDGRIVGRVLADGGGIRANLLADGGRLYAYADNGRLIAMSLQQ